MNEKNRRAMIPELDQLAEQADRLRREFDALLDEREIASDPTLLPASNASHQLVLKLRKASDDLKRAGTSYVKTCVTSWYHWRFDEEDPGREDPTYESIKYKGENMWELIMVSQAYGREKIVVNSDSATSGQVYSADPA